MYDSSEPSAAIDDKDKLLFEAWKQTEKVAMHFNELILGFRLKAFGAITVGAGILGGTALSGMSASSSPSILFALAGALVFFFIVWIAVWMIDAYYYQELLRGAVDEAERLEMALGKQVQLSLLIEGRLKKASPYRIGRRGFYLLTGFALFSAAVAMFVWARCASV